MYTVVAAVVVAVALIAVFTLGEPPALKFPGGDFCRSYALLYDNPLIARPSTVHTERALYQDLIDIAAYSAATAQQTSYLSNVPPDVPKDLNIYSKDSLALASDTTLLGKISATNIDAALSVTTYPHSKLSAWILAGYLPGIQTTNRVC
jgi:hypothetical protein